MDAAHVHLMLNHFPLIGMAFAIPLLLGAWIRKSEDLSRAGLTLVAVTGFLAVATLLTGEPAEEVGRRKGDLGCGCGGCGCDCGSIPWMEEEVHAQTCGTAGRRVVAHLDGSAGLDQQPGWTDQPRRASQQHWSTSFWWHRTESAAHWCVKQTERSLVRGGNDTLERF